MATTAYCAYLRRNDSGSLKGWVRPGWARERAREEASEPLRLCRCDANPAHVLPLRETQLFGASYHIEQVIRPAPMSNGRWNVSFTRCGADDETQVRYQVELDPTHRWWITRLVREDAGEWSRKADAQYELIGDALLPVTLHVRTKQDKGELHARWQVRPMLPSEQQELKLRVEQAVRSGPSIPYQGLRRFLLAIVITCPLAGVTLLGVTRRCEPPRETA